MNTTYAEADRAYWQANNKLNRAVFSLPEPRQTVGIFKSGKVDHLPPDVAAKIAALIADVDRLSKVREEARVALFATRA